MALHTRWMRPGTWALLFLVCAALTLEARPAQAWDPLQKAARAAARGQKALAAGDTLAAVDAFLSAQALAPEDADIRLGLGEAFYHSGEYRSSRGQFEAVENPGTSDELIDATRRQQALYNAGNAAVGMQDLQGALDLYTRAVAESEGPPPADLLYNLELTQKLLEQQQNEESQEGEGDEQDEPSEEGDSEPPESDSEGEEPPPEEQEQQQEEQNPDEEGEQQNPQEQPQEEPPAEEEAPPPTPEELVGAMTPEEAMRLLDALDHDEEELRKSIQRRLRGDDTESEHDW